MTIIVSSVTLRMVRALTVAACVAGLVLSPISAQPQATAKGPLSVTRQSFFYIGGHYDQTQPDRHVVGQMYVEY